MNTDQPLNAYEEKFGKPINGMVLISSSELVKPARRLVTFNADLIEAGRGLRILRTLPSN